MALNVLKNKLGQILNPIIPRYSYKIGDLFLTTNTENPNKRFGGTWELVAKGCTLIGVDENDSNFKSAMKTGGNKQLQANIYPFVNNGNLIIDYDKINPSSYHENTRVRSSISGFVQEDGHSEAGSFAISVSGYHPYFTCYIWRKTAN